MYEPPPTPAPSPTPAWAVDVPSVPVDGPPSWWQQRHPSPGWAPLAGDVDDVDVCVVGAGISGTSTAWHLARAGASVLLLDARSVAGGASGRNGGFLLAGLNVRYAELVGRIGRERARALYALTVAGRDELIATAARLGLAEHARQTGSLRLAVDAGEIDDLDAEHDLLAADGFDAERVTRAALPGTLGGHFLGGLRFARDGASVPAAWVRGLAAAAAADGVRICEHTPVAAIGQGEGDPPAVHTASGQRIRPRTAVVMCTEAYLPGLLPELRGLVRPYRSQVLAAAAPPGGGRVLPSPVWSRRGWDYAQQVASGELVVGGELEEDQSLYATWAEETDAGDQAMLEDWVRRVLGIEPAVLARWAGVLSFSFDDLPLVGALPGRPGVHVCGGWGGAGNVLGFVGGGLVAAAIGGDDVIPPEFDAGRLPH